MPGETVQKKKEKPKDTVQQKKVKQIILAFKLSNEELGLDISCVHEVLRPEEIHPLPQAPDFIEGVINLRGRIIAVMDLRKKFYSVVSQKGGVNIESAEDRPTMRIIVCKIKKFIVGLMVDSVTEVVSLSEADIQPTPEVVSAQIEDNYILGIARLGERVITILNLEEILTKEETDKLSKIKK